MVRTSIYANFSPQERGMMVGLLESGYSNRQVANIFDCNIKTVRLWRNRYELGGETMLNDHRCNNKRPRKTDPDQDDDLITVAEDRPSESAANLGALVNVSVSTDTVNRRLKEAGFVNRIAQCKPALTDNHRQRRIEYAINHLGWSETKWNQVIWSDEKCFSTAMNTKLKIWRPRGEGLNPKYVIPDQYSNRHNIMYWGCMTSLGLMALQETSSRMNAEEYCDILENVMLPAAREVYPENQFPNIFFMHDNSSVHTSRFTSNWFQNHPEIILLPHPAKSPDLNPIENIWSKMCQEWRTGNEVRTRDQLRENVMNVWNRLRLRPNITVKLVSSMHRRLQQIIVNQGYWIKY